MFIELVDSLRCPHRHDETWLVLGTGRMDGRRVTDGVLGCPTCRAQFRIDGGVADLRTAASVGVRSAAAPPPAPDPDQAMRLAALLNLTDAGGYAVLVGAWTVYAAALYALAGVQLLLVNPPPGGVLAEGMSGLLVDTRLSLAAASARGVAVDAEPSPALVGDAVAALRAKGRLVAPVGAAMPTGIAELARDAELWVGEREAGSSGLVSLSRGGR